MKPFFLIRRRILYGTDKKRPAEQNPEKLIADIKYSDVLQFYNNLLDKQGLQINTLESIHRGIGTPLGRLGL